MIVKYFFMLMIILLLSNNVIHSGTIDPNVPDQKYLEYAKDFHYVGKLCGQTNDNKNFCASCVAIDDETILTAAHVVNDIKTAYIYINDKKICVSKFIVHKDFETEFGIADIALGYCDETIGLKFYPELYEGDDEVDKVCSISGYGICGTFKTGAYISDNNKRAGSNIIDDIYQNLLVCTPSLPRSRGHTSLEFIIASGDSGGGLFIGNKLAGINSCVMATNRVPNSKYGDESCHTRISKFIDWIKEHRDAKKKK